jgi:hypothetical protein
MRKIQRSDTVLVPDERNRFGYGTWNVPATMGTKSSRHFPSAVRYTKLNAVEAVFS